MNARAILTAVMMFAMIGMVGGCGDEESPAAPSGGGVAAPSIAGILPPGAASGIDVKISGTNLGAVPGAVEVGGKDAAIGSWSETEVDFTMPAGLSESIGVSVKVTTGGGKVVTSSIDVTPPHTYRVTANGAMNHYPCWSAGGDWIYFSSTLSGGANWDVYRIPDTGGTAERITYDDAPDFYPNLNFNSGELAWSSQMRHINNTDGDYEIFYGYPQCAAPGAACTVAMLTNNDSRDLDPAWARTVYGGYAIAYTHEEVDQDGYFVAWKVWLHSNTGIDELTEGRQPAFSPNGQWVVYNHQDNLYKMPTGGGVAEQLTDTNHDWYPDWGPDDRIVFQRSNGGNFEDIFVMNADGTGVTPLVSTRSNEYCPTWSPDGRKVVYYALVGGSFDIYVYVMP